MLACLAARANAAPYVIDPTHTFVYFEAPAFGLSTQRGRFDRTRGEVEFDRLGRSASVEVRITTASLSTGVAALDLRLCAADMLDCNAHPQALFRATKFAFDSSGKPTEVQGDLTLRGQTLPLTLRAQRFSCYPNLLLLREVCGGDFETALEPAAFGMAAGAASGLPKDIRLFIQVEAIKQ
ncbi:MAG: YceI family protein [Burkholderiales bacterium]